MLPRAAPGARADRNPARPLTARLATILLLAGALAVAGCGGDDEAGDGGATAPAPAEGTELTVTLDPEGTGRAPEVAEVSCPADPAEGSEPACEAVAELPAEAAEPVPPGAVCTEIYGGPDVVHLEGTLDGEPLDAELTRENGCEIERFERFLPLLRELFEGYRPGGALLP